MANVDEYISSTQDLINKMGDISSGETQKVINEYNNISVQWNQFLDDEVAKYRGGPATTASEQEKIDYIAERSFYSNDNGNFLTSLKSQVEKRDSRKKELEKQAEEILNKQRELLSKNDAIINELTEELEKDTKTREGIEEEIEKLNTENETLNEKARDRREWISDLEDEISSLDPVKDAKSIEQKKKQIYRHNQELKAFMDKGSEIDGEIKNKERAKRKINISSRKTKLTELKNKNKELSQNIDANYKSFKENGMNIESQSMSAPEAPEKKLPITDGKQQEDNKGTQKVSGTAQFVPPAAEQQGLVKLSDKKIAKNMCKELRDCKTTAEIRKMIDGYGYTDLVAMMPYLNLVDRKRMHNVIGEERDSLDIPNEADFNANLASMLSDPSLSSDCYSLLFENNSPRDFKSLSVDELRKVQKVLDNVNSRRGEIGKNNPELLKYFDKNFVQFVKTGSLLEKVKTGRIKGFFADMVNGKQKAVRDKITGSMRDYTMASYDENINKQAYANSIREALGQEVKPIEERSVRSNTRHESQLQNIDKSQQAR